MKNPSDSTPDARSLWHQAFEAGQVAGLGDALEALARTLGRRTTRFHEQEITPRAWQTSRSAIYQLRRLKEGGIPAVPTVAAFVALTRSAASTDVEHFTRREGIFGLTEWRKLVRASLAGPGALQEPLERMEQFFAQVVEPLIREELRSDHQAMWSSAIQFLAQDPADATGAFEALGEFLDRPRTAADDSTGSERASALRALEQVSLLLPPEPLDTWQALENQADSAAPAQPSVKPAEAAARQRDPVETGPEDRAERDGAVGEAQGSAASEARDEETELSNVEENSMAEAKQRLTPAAPVLSPVPDFVQLPEGKAAPRAKDFLDRAILPRLRRSLATGNMQERQTALHTLRRLQGRAVSAIPELLAIVDQPRPDRVMPTGADTQLRGNALSLLSDLVARLAAPAMASQHRQAVDRKRILEALRGLAGSDPDPAVRSAALEGLLRLRDPEAADTGFAALEDDDPGVRVAAVGLLVHRAGDHMGLPAHSYDEEDDYDEED